MAGNSTSRHVNPASTARRTALEASVTSVLYESGLYVMRPSDTYAACAASFFKSATSSSCAEVDGASAHGTTRRCNDGTPIAKTCCTCLGWAQAPKAGRNERVFNMFSETAQLRRCHQLHSKAAI
jgi:hypothetical protein